MSMPQVHIVAYCGDLGFGAARGAQMLSLMLGMGIVSRLVSGWISDHIGGLYTLLLGSVLQGVALLMFLWADGVSSLFLVSAMFGLFQGGIVPSYALIVREYFTPKEAGARVGTVLMATLFGMALGGWMSGAIFDLTRLVPRGLRQRHRLEPAQRRHRAVPAGAGQAAGAVRAAAADGLRRVAACSGTRARTGSDASVFAAADRPASTMSPRAIRCHRLVEAQLEELRCPSPLGMQTVASPMRVARRRIRR